MTGPPHAQPLRALPENIALDIVYEDDDLAIVNKPAGMMVHAGAGATDDARNRGTLVNALLHHFKTCPQLEATFVRVSSIVWIVRPADSMVVAKNDESHQRAGQAVQRAGGSQNLYRPRARVAEKGSRHRSERHQPALATPHPHDYQGFRRARRRDPLLRANAKSTRPTANLPCSKSKLRRDAPTRFGCTCHRLGIRSLAMRFMERPANSAAQSNKRRAAGMPAVLKLDRNFLHSAALELTHPRTKAPLRMSRPLPPELAICSIPWRMLVRPRPRRRQRNKRFGLERKRKETVAKS